MKTLTERLGEYIERTLPEQVREDWEATAHLDQKKDEAMLKREHAVKIIHEILLSQSDNYVEAICEGLIPEDADIPSADELMLAVGITQDEIDQCEE